MKLNGKKKAYRLDANEDEIGPGRRESPPLDDNLDEVLLLADFWTTRRPRFFFGDRDAGAAFFFFFELDAAGRAGVGT